MPCPGAAARVFTATVPRNPICTNSVPSCGHGATSHPLHDSPYTCGSPLRDRQHETLINFVCIRTSLSAG